MKSPPFGPARYTIADVAAIKALEAGNASESQQKRALRWIVHGAAMTYDETFVAGQTDTSGFLQGRRSVGLQIVKLINVPISGLKPDEERKTDV